MFAIQSHEFAILFASKSRENGQNCRKVTSVIRFERCNGFKLHSAERRSIFSPASRAKTLKRMCEETSFGLVALFVLMIIWSKIFYEQLINLIWCHGPGIEPATRAYGPCSTNWSYRDMLVRFVDFKRSVVNKRLFRSAPNYHQEGSILKSILLFLYLLALAGIKTNSQPSSSVNIILPTSFQTISLCYFNTQIKFH